MLRGDATLSDALVAKTKATKSHAKNTTILIQIIPHAGFLRCMQGCGGIYSACTFTVWLILTNVLDETDNNGHPKIIPDETLTRVLQELMITFFDVTSNSPTNDGVTMQVHGRLILKKSAKTAGPSFFDPSQLVIKLFSSEHEI